MANIKKINGGYYLCVIKIRKNVNKSRSEVLKDTYLVRYTSSRQGKISMGELQIYCPEELIGKKIRLKMEIVYENS